MDDFSSRDRDDKESFKEALIALAETTNGLAYSDQDTANKVVDTFTAQMKAQQGNSGGESRRRRRDVNVGAEEEVEAKEIDEVKRSNGSQLRSCVTLFQLLSRAL